MKKPFVDMLKDAGLVVEVPIGPEEETLVRAFHPEVADRIISTKEGKRMLSMLKQTYDMLMEKGSLLAGLKSATQPDLSDEEKLIAMREEHIRLTQHLPDATEFHAALLLKDGSIIKAGGGTPDGVVQACIALLTGLEGYCPHIARARAHLVEHHGEDMDSIDPTSMN